MESIQLDLVNQLKDLEIANENLEDRIEALIQANEQLEKNQAVYIGHRESKVDKELAKFINRKFPEKDKLKIMFIRESEGVYQFGQRRVHIKCEKGNQLLVRVGGGFIGIEDFVGQFTESETEKIERRDVLTRFQSKVAV